MSRIRILHFVSSLSKSSGVMSVIMNYYRHIDRDNVQFDFMFFKDIDNTYEEEIRNYGGRVYYISKPSLNKAFKQDLSEILKKDKYIALHIHEVYLTFLLAPIAKKNGISNIITHSHTTMYSDKLISAVRNRLLCLGLKKQANHYFACSKAAGEFLYGRKSLNDDNVVVVNNAVDCQKFRFNQSVRDSTRRNLGLQNHIVIGHVGRFNEQKNHMFLIEIFATLKKKENKAKLILVGEGPLFEQVKERINQLNISKDVILLGKRNDVPDLLQAMDVFLLPSLFEGLPVVAVEAQAAGLPSIISDTVTDEIKFTNLVNFKSLKSTPIEWANVALSIRNETKRYDTSKEIMDAGYDIKNSSIKLERFYTNLSNNI